jgi:hypothetical protein
MWGQDVVGPRGSVSRSELRNHLARCSSTTVIFWTMFSTRYSFADEDEVGENRIIHNRVKTQKYEVYYFVPMTQTLGQLDGKDHLLQTELIG